MDTGASENQLGCDAGCPDLLDLDDFAATKALHSPFFETPNTTGLGPLDLAGTETLPDRFMSVCDPEYATPMIKSNGFLDQPVRRRLVFSPVNPESSLEPALVQTPKEPEIPLDINVTDKPAPLDATDKPVEDAHDINHRSSLITISLDASTNAEANNGCDGSAKEPAPQETLKAETLEIGPAAEVKPVENKEQNSSNDGNRRVAQLVIWTKSNTSGKTKSTCAKKPAPVLPKPPQPILLATGSSEFFKRPEGELFVVQYPVRSLTETSKNKTKGPKRRRGAVSPTCSNHPKRKSGHKQKRSAASSGQGSSSGRAYRAYLHTCLEKQRQQLRTSADFKVEKLFQPEQGVALPGEIVPPVPNTTVAAPPPTSTTQAHTSEISVETQTQPPPTVAASEEDVNSTTYQKSAEPYPEKEGDTTSSTSAAGPPPPASSPKAGPSSEGLVGDPSLIEICIEGEGGDSTFELPDRFTVTTDSTNEFDLLIQNVVHEEMVDDAGEDELMKYERYRKRMRLSEGSGAPSEDGTNIMDEAGKPRCTYTELIEKALTETGGLTVSEIYNWISERYPFFKPDDDRWKNSVRHNLSINPYFKKGDKARSGAGHLWTISEESKGLRPSMVSWDEKRKSPCDPCDLIMPIVSETDRAVANILGRYASECRQQASVEKVKRAGRNGEESGSQECNSASPAASQEVATSTSAAPQQSAENGATCNTVAMPETASFNLNELNSGQFTVDLSGITIPEGGSLNLEDLANNGRLIYIQTDPDANKENDSSQALILNEYMLSELTALTSGTTSAQDEERFSSVFSDPSLSFDLGFGKVDAIPCTTFNNDVSQINSSTTATSTFSSATTVGNCHQNDVLGEGCSQMIHSTDHHSIEFNPHHDLIALDQVIPISMPTFESTAPVIPTNTGLTENLSSISAAALYESKELGIPYMYQTEPSHDLL